MTVTYSTNPKDLLQADADAHLLTPATVEQYARFAVRHLMNGGEASVSRVDSKLQDMNVWVAPKGQKICVHNVHGKSKNVIDVGGAEIKLVNEEDKPWFYSHVLGLRTGLVDGGMDNHSLDISDDVADYMVTTLGWRFKSEHFPEISWKSADMYGDKASGDKMTKLIYMSDDLGESKLSKRAARVRDLSYADTSKRHRSLDDKIEDLHTQGFLANVAIIGGVAGSASAWLSSNLTHPTVMLTGLGISLGFIAVGVVPMVGYGLYKAGKAAVRTVKRHTLMARKLAAGLQL